MKQISEHLYCEYFPLCSQLDEQALQDQLTKHFNNSWLTFSPLISQALTHKSFSHETNNKIANNERLEFLGDSVLSLIITEKLMSLYPELSEGKLSKLRSSLVNEKILAGLAEFMGLGKWLLLGKGELKEKGHQKKSILSDAFEAVLGAYYLQNGLGDVTDLVDRVYLSYQKENSVDLFSLSALEQFDAKSKLQELSLEKFKVLPEYDAKQITEKGQQVFEVSVILKGKTIAIGKNISKKKCMQLLAKKIIDEKLLNKLEEKLC